MRVDVLPEDIEAARDQGTCLVEMALERITSVPWVVDFETTYPLDLDGLDWLRLPDPVINKLADWDDFKDVEPFSFDIDLSEEVEDFIKTKEDVEE